MEERPALAEEVKPRVDELQRQWDELENVTHEKGENMLEANRGELLFSFATRTAKQHLSLPVCRDDLHPGFAGCDVILVDP